MSCQALFLVAVASGVCEVSLTSSFTGASSRLKLLPAVQAAETLALQPRLLSVDVNQPDVINYLGNPKVCIVDKIMSNRYERICGFAMAALAALARLKNQGTKICLLYSDHHAPTDSPGGYLYRDLLRMADVVVVPSEAMAAAVGDGAEARGDCVVIEDPWQVREQPFTPWRPGEPLRLAWFGNPSNVGYLCDQLGPLMQQACGADAYELTVLARRESVAAIDRAFAAASAIRPWRLLPVEWNSRDQPQQLERVLGGSHVCLLPSDHADYKKIGVSHNRLVDSVRSGCVVIASPMASYLELAKLALISTDFPSTLNRLGSNYERLCGKYEGLRRRELARFSPALNQQKWTDLLSAMA